MPLFRQVPPANLRVAKNNSTQVGANSDAPKAVLFTVPTNRKYHVYAVGCDQNGTGVDFLAVHVAGSVAAMIVDIPSQRLPTDERIVLLAEDFNEGESLLLGLRNGTGLAITPQLVAFYADQPA